MRAKLMANLQGRAASYWLNAQSDAQLALAIIEHLKEKVAPSPPDTRFEQLLYRARKKKEADDFLAACAFSLWEINGRMDYVVARLYARLSCFTAHLPPMHYEEIPPTPFPLVSCWSFPLLNKQAGLRNFLRKHRFAIKDIDVKVFRQAIGAVQEINIIHNREIITSFAQSSSEKTKRLSQMSHLSPNPGEFMRAAQNTQRAAIFWDQLYIKLLKFVNKLTTTLSG